MPAFASRALTALALAALAATAMSGCASEPTPVPSATATATPSATPTPTATAAPAPTSTPMTIGCDKLISAQAMYDFNPNFGANASFTPASGTDAAKIVDLGGLACGWVNQTSGEVIQVAVANLPDASLTQLKNDFVTTSNSVPTYGVEGYFQLVGTLGQAEAFSGSYWISAVSDSFFEPGDAAPIIAAAIAGLG